MTLEARAGSFVANTVDGAQSIKGLGFTPKIVFFGHAYYTDAAWETRLPTHASMLGAASAPAEEFTFATADDDGVTRSRTARLSLSDSVLSQVAGATANVIDEANLVSLDADGFTVNWTSSPSSPQRITFLALGGDDLTNAKAHHFDTRTGTGLDPITGVGFQPDAAIFTSGLLPTPGTTITAVSHIGASDGSSEKNVSWWSVHNLTTTNTGRSQKDAALGAYFEDAPLDEGSLESFDADGFTLDWTTKSSTRQYGAACFKGGKYKVGSFASPTTPGLHAGPSLGFTPIAVLFFTSGQDAAGGSSDILMGMGSCTTSDQWAFGSYSQDNVGTSNSGRRSSITKSIYVPNVAGGVTLAARRASLDPDNWTLDWSVVDATPRIINYIAFGANVDPTPTETKTVWYESNEPARPLRATKGGLNEGRMIWLPLLGETGTLLDNLFEYDAVTFNGARFAWTSGRHDQNAGLFSPDETNTGTTSIPIPGLTDAFSEATVSVWATMENTTGQNILFERGGNAHGIAIGYRSTPQTISGFATANSNVFEIATTETFSADPSRFIHVVLVFDRGETVLYIDGVEANRGTHPTATTIPAATNPAGLMGNSDDTPADFASPRAWKGTLSEFSYYTRGLSSLEVRELHKEGRRRNPTTLERNRYPITVGAPSPPTSIVPILDHHARMMG